MKEIITDLEKLNTPAEPLVFIDDSGIHSEEGQEIINKIKKAMGKSKKILALSAPQIGINKRIFCIRFDDSIRTFINPIITKKTNYQIAIETCASMPGKEILSTRPEEITVIYYNDSFKYEDNKLLGVAARLLDQQANILDGVMPSELGLVSDIETDGSFKELTEEEIPQVLDIYKKFIAAKSEALSKAIEADEEIFAQYRQLRFTEKVINGEASIVSDDTDRKLNREQRRTANKQSKKIAAHTAVRRNKYGK